MSENKNLWSPWDIFLKKPEAQNFAMLILNQSVNFHGPENDLIVELWNLAKVRVLVDGGTDRWLKWTTENHLSKTVNPHLVTGDFDSIRKETLEYFRKQADVKVIHTTDQDNTDFAKALIELQKYVAGNSIKVDRILVVCEMSGRFDHTMSNVNCLHRKDILPKNVQLFIFSHMNFTWFLDGNGAQHEIVVPQELIDAKKACGLLPIGKPSVSVTKGLKWNLDNNLMEFGGLVSSSNTYKDDRLFIETDNPLIFTMEITGLLKSFLKYFR